MTEDHGSYDDADSADATDGVELIGDILRQIIDERGWPLPAVYPQPNGDSPDDAGRRDD